jgi:hypothetical protein
VNQIFTGRSEYSSDATGALGSLLVAVRCKVGAGGEEDFALVDTASQWCVLPPDVAIELGYTPTNDGATRLHTRFGVLSGELVRLPVIFAADEGEPAEVEATWFLSPDWPGPLVIGWKGCLERVRFAFDPRGDSFYFAEC